MTGARDTKEAVELGDETALDAIYREHFEFVWSVLRRLGVADADVEDASQDVFVVAHRRLAQFEGRAAVRTWLYSIAMRVAANRRRKHARRDALIHLHGVSSPMPDDLEELAARGEARAILERLLDRLDEHKRVVFVLAELEELTVPAIADLVGENPRTIYSRLRAARAAVATDLERLHAPAPIDLGAAIVATRPRAAIPAERARRAWAAVVAKLAVGVGATPVAATGVALWGKIAIVAVTTIGVGAWAVSPTDEPAPSKTRAAEVTPEVTPPSSVVAEAPATQLRAPVITPSSDLSPLSPPRVAARKIDVPEPPTASSSTLADEIVVLDRARAFVSAGDPNAALAELERYAARFARGTMQREASGIRVAALCNAGRETEAHTIAAAAGLPTPHCAVK